MNYHPLQIALEYYFIFASSPPDEMFPSFRVFQYQPPMGFLSSHLQLDIIL